MRNFFELEKTVPNYSRFGELLKAWADGTETRYPKTIKSFQRLLRERSIVAHFPDSGSQMGKIRKIKYKHLKNDVLLVNIPTWDMIEIGEEDARSVVGEYPLPGEYDMAYEGHTPVSNLDPDDLATIFYARVGDYAIGSCM